MSYFVESIILWYEKEKIKKEKKKTSYAGGRIRTWNLWITKLAPYHRATETNCNNVPVQSHNSNFDLNNLIKCLIKVVNVSKSQYYEFRHNIMNLGNQNSKYSWRIRDLENPQTGIQFANSVLMYKITEATLGQNWGRIYPPPTVLQLGLSV